MIVTDGLYLFHVAGLYCRRKVDFIAKMWLVSQNPGEKVQTLFLASLWRTLPNVAVSKLGSAAYVTSAGPLLRCCGASFSMSLFCKRCHVRRLGLGLGPNWQTNAVILHVPIRTSSPVPLFGIDFEPTKPMNLQGRGSTLFRSDVQGYCMQRNRHM